jgi:dipeptidyl-peptidase-4
VDVRSGRVRWLELAEDVEYVARVDWTPGGGTLALQLQPRDQRRLELVLVAPEAGEAEVLVTETSETFVNLHDDLTFLDDGRFLWSSERSGTRQIYLYDDGEPLQLTDGALPVLAVEGVDEGTGKVLYTAVTNRSLEAHLFAVPLEGGAPVQLTRKSGWHSVTVSEDGTHWVDTHSAAVQPPRSRVFDAAGERVAVLEANPTEELDALLDTGPEFTTVVAADGETELNASFIKPPSFDESEQHPLVVYGYGGPHGHVVADRWRRSSLFSHYLASRGYVVFSVDPRGSNHRGKRFEDAVHRSFGQVEVRDHAAAVEQVSDLPWVDPERIGIWGWSYGGYLAVMSLLSTEGVYRCGLAVAPVTNWHWYDTHYTERYLGMPDDEQVYDAASALERDPSGLTERLLVVHGMADDNVFLRHSLALIARLQEAGVQFETMLYPGKTHLIAGKNARKHLFTMMAGYWDRCLMEPPAP